MRWMMIALLVSLAALLMAATVAACGSSSSATPPVIYITPRPPTLAPGATPTVAPSAAGISSTIISTSAPDGRWTVISHGGGRNCGSPAEK